MNRKFAGLALLVVYSLVLVLYYISSKTSRYRAVTPLNLKKNQSFTSPYVVDENEQDPWKTADIWRQRLVDQKLSTAWLPIMKDVSLTNGAAHTGNDTATTSNVSHTGTAKAKKKDTIINVALYQGPEWLPPRKFTFSKCKYNNCRYIGEENTQDVDALIVYALNIDLSRVPRWPHQVFLMLTVEAPGFSGFLAPEVDEWWNTAFNMTLNYRVSSDVFMPYGFLKHQPKPANELPDYMALAEGKTKMVAWLVSSCHTPSGRQQYVDELQNHIQVDIYGACGQHCNTSDDFFCEEIRQYRFYLSFENSICDDYVTEKYFKLFGKHILPIVRGGTDFKRYFPPYTFIDAMDFASPKLLAQELIRLSMNLSEYTRYLKTMDEYRVLDTHVGFPCQLCKKLNMVDYTKSTYYDMRAWLGEVSHCTDSSRLGTGHETDRLPANNDTNQDQKQ